MSRLWFQVPSPRCRFRQICKTEFCNIFNSQCTLKSASVHLQCLVCTMWCTVCYMQLHSTFTCRATAPSNVHTECFEVFLIQPPNIESCDLSIVSSVVTCPRLSRGNVVIIMATFRGNNQICRKGLSLISHSLRSLILLTGEMFDPSELVFSSYIYMCSLYWSHTMQFQCILCNYTRLLRITYF